MPRLTLTSCSQWRDYCESRGEVFKIIKAVFTGFVPTLLIQLWQVGRGML